MEGENRKMKRPVVFVLFVVSPLTIVLTAGCQKMSELEEDESAGINGGFEVSRNGLPVNWIMYTPNTVPDADFRIVLDRDVFREGQQSLRFDVESCRPTGGWKSPGFTNEFSNHGNGRFGQGRYQISFWVRNNGSTFWIMAGAVSAMKGDMETLIKTDEQIDSWKRLEYEINVPEDRWLRLQLDIVRPGTFWIDDVRVERKP